MTKHEIVIPESAAKKLNQVGDSVELVNSEKGVEVEIEVSE